jgi:hypothetical protein
MPRAVSSGSSTLRRLLKANRLLRTGHLAMRACAFCLSRNELCVVAAGCDHCEQCYRSNRRCELAPPCAEIERLFAKDEELSKQVLELETKSLRAQRERRRVR